jgi:hypothetical protein
LPIMLDYTARNKLQVIYATLNRYRCGTAKTTTNASAGVPLVYAETHNLDGSAAL